ncbi:hypothetical protein APSETT444_009037 [Aspergillus pseudonomiae]
MTPQRGPSRSVTGGVRSTGVDPAHRVEHWSKDDLDRYWGESSPYEQLTAETLQYLTLEQSILDLTYFAETVQLKFDTSNSSNAPRAPWVLVGGSYSGALAAWTAAVAPETFWAYHATSAPVEAIDDFWQYFDPIRHGMAPNCSRDVSLVANHIDSVGKNGSAAAQSALKELFGLGALEHYDDFAAQYDPWRDSGVSSTHRPGGPLTSTPDEPVQVIPGGFHCSDLYLKDYYANAGVKQVVDNAVAQIKSWVAEYYK